MYLTRTFLLVLFLLNTNQFKTSAQQFLVGGGPTVTTYFGDLAPYNLKQSFTQLHTGLSFSFSSRIIKNVYAGAEIAHNTLSGDDKAQKSESRLIRNLSFRSPVTSAAFMAGIRLPLLNQQRVGIKLAGGLAGFKFDPQAKYNNKWIRLQPLGTEGQGLPGRPKHYGLIKGATILQLGAFVRLSRKIYLDVEFSNYFTDTDYLDDVSGKYYDNELLRAAKGNLAADLADRGNEINPQAPKFDTSINRGNPFKADQFAYMKIGISVAIDRNKYETYKESYSSVHCPKVVKEWYKEIKSTKRSFWRSRP